MCLPMFVYQPKMIKKINIYIYKLYKNKKTMLKVLVVCYIKEVVVIYVVGNA